MPMIRVGGHEVEVTPAEYAVAVMKPGTPVRFAQRLLSGSPGRTGTGVFRGSWCFDSVHGSVELHGGGIINLCVALGDTLEPLVDMRELAATGCGGDGI